MKKNKKLIYIIIAISFIAVSAIGATYAYFLASGYSNKTSTVSVTADALDEVSCTATDLSMTVTGSDMKQSSSSSDGTVGKTNNSTITCSATKHTTGTTECTMNIKYTPTNVFTKSANNTLSKRELTLSGAGTTTNGTINTPVYNERDMSTLTSTTTIIDNLKWVFDNNDTLTYTMTTKFYNYDFNQNDLANHTYSGTISVANISCTSVNPTYSTVTLNANGGSVSSSSKQVTEGYTYGNLPQPTKSGATFKGWSQLPSGYQQVEFIELNGNQYINTNYTLTGNKAEFDVEFTYNASNEIEIVSNHGSPRSVVLGIYNNTGFLYDGSLATDVFTPVLSKNEKHTMYAYLDGTKKYIIYDGIKTNDYTPYSSLNFNNEKLILFRLYSNTNSYNFVGKIYYLKIYDNGTLVKNFIPCLNTSTSKYGLCDLANNGTFYGNSGSGDFTGGPSAYVTKDSVVNISGNHTLNAMW